MRLWKRLSEDEIKQNVFDALKKNVDFRKGKFLGVPASHLDEKVFYSDAPFLKDAPYMSTMVANPNHIGCHTLGESEEFFSGTHVLEKELIRICAEEILGGDAEMQDGYVASGGTEANIQALWVYRNYFLNEHKANRNEIAILCSTDTHYAIYKGADLLCLDVYPLEVSAEWRSVSAETIKDTLKKAKTEGKKYFIVFVNMATTMFGSVDDTDLFVSALQAADVSFKIHVDGAFGGFIYPFTAQDDKLTFKNPHITSFTLDAHKLAQAPYGTGIFLIRKNYINHVFTEEAQYVHGQDITLVGSRSGANAIAVWMILATYGPHGWREKINTLIHRTNWLCQALDKKGITYYRHPLLNIVTMHAHQIPAELAHEFHLVPDNHHAPNWYKIVVMGHVTIDLLEEFTNRL